MTGLLVRDHPEYGVATIPFPIPREEYDRRIRELAALEIGDAVRRNCQVLEVSNPWLALKRLGGSRSQSGRVGLSGQAAGQLRNHGNCTVSGHD